MQAKWLITGILLLAIIPLLLSVPAVSSGDYGKETSRATTTTTTANQAATITSTSVPEHVDPILPLIFAAGVLLIYGKFTRDKRKKEAVNHSEP